MFAQRNHGVTERSIIVTGGGTGIGAACAARLVAEGAKVTICGRTEAKLVETVDRLAPLAAEAGSGGEIRPVVADVTDEAAVIRLVDAATGAFGDLHGVVANAGGGGAIVPFHLQEVDEFLRVLHLNVLGTMLLVKHTVRRMVAAGGGSFVAMSSIAGQLTHPYFGAYTVAKAGVEALMRNAADEYGEVQVRFNAVRPGFTTTEIMELIPRDSEVYASYIANTPMAGVGEPDDVAELVRFLLGDESRWITGQVLNVDGGHGLRRGPDFSSFVEPVLGRDTLLARD
jgi:NAD(P)-dependent dehydrogenase (short-subunit alcohol dehydrogenase family)